MFSNLGRYPNRLDRKHSSDSLLLESFVHDVILQSGLENFLVAVPFVGILLMGLFRLDEIIATSKRAKAVKRRVCGRDENGRLLLSDPDGRPWGSSPKAR
jgi:hypothetical protein